MLLLLLACDQRPPHVDFSPPSPCPSLEAWAEKIGVIAAVDGEIDCQGPDFLAFVTPVSKHSLLKGGATFAASENCGKQDVQQIALPATSAAQAWAWARQCLPSSLRNVDLTTGVRWSVASEPTGIGGMRVPSGTSLPVVGEWKAIADAPAIKLSMTPDSPGTVANRVRWVWRLDWGEVVLDKDFPDVRISVIIWRSGP